MSESKIEALKNATLSTTLQEIPFKIDGDVFIIRELLTKDRDAFLQEQNARMEISPDGKNVKFKNFKGIQADLLKRCLFKEGEDLPVKVDLIQGWRADLVQKIFDAAQELNGLTKESAEDKEDEAKND